MMIGIRIYLGDKPSDDWFTAYNSYRHNDITIGLIIIVSGIKSESECVERIQEFLDTQICEPWLSINGSEASIDGKNLKKYLFTTSYSVVLNEFDPEGKHYRARLKFGRPDFSKTEIQKEYGFAYTYYFKGWTTTIVMDFNEYSQAVEVIGNPNPIATKLREEAPALDSIASSSKPPTTSQRPPTPHGGSLGGEITSRDDGYQVVLLIHGIRTQADWGPMVQSKLEVPGQIDVIPIRYGYFDAFRFWFPFWTRNKPIERVYEQIRVALQKYRRSHPDAKLSIIAHSFGTYIIGEILKRGFDLQIDRLLLCGSVLPQGFLWHQYQGRFADDKVVNECGKADVWPVLAQSASWGYGASGTHGFGAVLVKDRFHAGGHGQYFDSGFVEKYWEPFIRRGEYRGTAFETKMPPTPWWLSVLGILPLQWMIVALIVLALALATWPIHGMNVTPFQSRSNTESSAYSHKQPLKPVLPDDIDIASASFMDYEGDVRAPRLDLKLTNMGARPAFITQVKVNVKRTWRLRDLPQVPGVIVPPGHNYVVKLKPREGPYQETKGLSEGLGKDEFGRFSLQFEEDPWAASNLRVAGFARSRALSGR